MVKKLVEPIEANQLRAIVQSSLAEHEIKVAKQKADARASNEQRLRNLLRNVLGVEFTGSFDSHNQMPVAEVDGFRFTLAWLRNCPLCDKDQPRSVSNYTSLDETKPIGYPHGEGNCIPKANTQIPETTEMLLLQKLREFVL